MMTQYKLSLFVWKIEKMEILAISLMKEVIQNLNKVLFCFMNQIAPKTELFKALNLSQNQWENISSKTQFVNLMQKYEQNLEQINAKFEETIEALQHKYSQQDFIEMKEVFQDLDIPVNSPFLVSQLITNQGMVQQKYPNTKEMYEWIVSIKKSPEKNFLKND